MTDTARPRKKRSKYPLVLLAILIVNAILIVLVLNWLRTTLTDYELRTPRRALDTYFTQLANEDRQTIQNASGFTPDTLNGWDDYFAVLNGRFGGHRPEQLAYRQKASTTLPAGQQLYAIYAGDEALGEVILSPDGNAASGWSVHSEISYLPGYTVKAPAGVRVSVGGLDLGVGQQQGVHPVTISYTRDGKLVDIEIFSALNESSIAPTVTEYQTPPTLFEPEFTAIWPAGDECVVQVDRDHRIVTVSIPAEPELRDTLGARMELVAKSYSDFITEDGTLAALRPYLYRETSLYRDYSEYQTGWYLSHERREFSPVEVSDIFIHSDDFFTGHIEFTVTIYRGTDVHVFTPSYDMAFIRVEDKWLMAGLHTRPTETAENVA